MLMQLREIEAEVEAKRRQVIIAESQLSSLPQYMEFTRLGNGKSFGEKALLSDSLRAATIVCSQNCHFAVMNKTDY